MQYELSGSIKCVNFLTSCRSLSFSRRNLPRGASNLLLTCSLVGKCVTESRREGKVIIK